MKGQNTVSKGLDEARIKTEQLRQETIKNSNAEKQANATRREALASLRQSVLIENQLRVARKNLGVDTEKLSYIQKRLTASYLTGNIAARAISFTVSSMARAFGFVVGAAIEFEFSMTKIGVIAGVAGADLTSLEKTIRTIAIQSPKTASEVAEAALAMAKMGVSGKELEDSLEGVVGLSTVLDESVESVGKTLLAVTKVFGLSTGQMTETASKLFTLLASSALDLEQFSTAFAYVGPTARMAGIEFEQMGAMMGVLADNGIKASTIGTQLRQVFSRLDTSSSKASLAVGAQSIKVNGLRATLEALKPQIKESGDAFELFGLRAIPVIDILINNADAIDKLALRSKNMEKNLKSASDLMRDTLKGSIDGVGGAFEELGIVLMDIFGPGLVTILKTVDKVITGIAGNMSGTLRDAQRDAANLNRLNAAGGGVNALGQKPANGVLSREDILDRINKKKEEHRKLEKEIADEVARAQAKETDLINSLKEEVDLFEKAKELAEARANAGVKLGKTSVPAQIKGALDLAAKARSKGLDEEEIRMLRIVKELRDGITKAAKEQTKAVDDASKAALSSLNKEIEVLEKKIALKTKEQTDLEKKVKYQNAVREGTEGGAPSETKELFALQAQKDEILKIEHLSKAERLQIEEDFRRMKQDIIDKYDKIDRDKMISNGLAVASSVEGFVGALGGLAQVRTDNAVKAAQAEGQSEAQINAIRKRGFEQQKKYMLLTAIMSTAAGMVRAYVDPGGIPGLAVAAFIALTGLTQVATINAQKFAKGFSGRVNQPTMIQVGEEGPEDVIVKSRSKTGNSQSGGNTIVVNVSGDINGEETFLRRLRKAQEKLDRRTV